MIAVGSYLDSKRAGKEKVISNMGNQRELSFVVGLWLQSLGTASFAIELNYETFRAMFTKHFLWDLRIVFQKNISL